MTEMKIYFAGSIRGGRDDVDLYMGIIKHLQTYGKVLSEHVGDKELKLLGEDKVSDEQIHNRDLEWVLECDVMVAEVTNPSLGVGYEIRGAVENGKKVLCLYRPQKGKILSAMIAGCQQVENVEYLTLDQAKSKIDDFMDKHSFPRIS